MWIAVTWRIPDGLIAQISGRVDTISVYKKFLPPIHMQLSDVDYDLGTSMDDLHDDIYKLSKKLDSLNNSHKSVRNYHRRKSIPNYKDLKNAKSL